MQYHTPTNTNDSLTKKPDSCKWKNEGFGPALNKNAATMNATAIVKIFKRLIFIFF